MMEKELDMISVIGHDHDDDDDDDDEEPNISVHEPIRRRPGDQKKKATAAILIPGLPDDIAEQCLLRIPYPYQAPVRAVSSSWNTLIKDPAFVLSKKYLSLSVPYIFVMSFHNSSTSRIQWQALDPRSGCWFVLPPMPPGFTPTPSSLACASVQRLGQLFVLAGIMRSSSSDTDQSPAVGTVVTYHVSSNRWSVRSPMLTPRAFFTAESVSGKIVAIGGCGPDNPSTAISSVECYDPTTDTWTEAAEMRQHRGLAKYDSAVIGNRVYMTEGWTWPFMVVPRGAVYDSEIDAWREMSEGMREGWTGFSIVMWNRLFVMSEHGDHRLKVYVPETDTWCYVDGDKFPCGALQKPFAVTSGEGTIYVMSSGLNVGLGRVSSTTSGAGGGFSVEWRVVAAPKAFRDLSPCNAQLLYA